MSITRPNATREFDFTEKDFEKVRLLLYKNVGISLSPSKQELVYSRLARRLRANNLNSFSDYLRVLDDSSHPEWEAFVNSLTTNLTSFFREEHHFPLLAEQIKKLNRPASLWCSAASTGEEPYSMAMTMADLFGTLTPPVRILATDVDTNVLEKAKNGIYPIEQVQKLPADKVKKYFVKGTGSNEGSARVRQELRDMIAFRKLNLLDKNWPIKGPFDAIFCRNVMIYFDKPTQADILRRFIPLMHPDALLYAGHSESFHHVQDAFRLRGKTVYELAKKSHG